MNRNKLTRWRYSLNVRLSCLAGILLLLIGTIIGATLWVTSAQEADGLVINLAGRQRMLIQILEKEFLSEARLRQVAPAAERFAAGISRRAADGRAYYTRNVIRKLQKEYPDFKADALYHQIEKALPLPATYAREVFESTGQADGYRYELLSKWNINEANGLRDGFEQRAWQSLIRNAQTPYREYVPAGGGVELRYATADVASDEACVSCHNTHPASPKKDFKLHDLMGIQVVSVAVTQDPAWAKTLLDGDHVHRPAPAQKTRQLFEITLAALRDGGTTYADLEMTEPVAVPVPTNPRIRNQLTEVDALWKQLQQAASGMEFAEVHSTAYQEHLNRFHESNMACLEEVNKVVGMYQANSEAKVAWLTKTQYTAGGVALVVFIALVGVSRGTADRRRVEATLRLQSSALESAANAMMITDREGCITWVNPAFTRLTGYVPDEVLGQNPRLLKSGVHSDSLYRDLWETILSGQVWHGEIVNRRKDGGLYREEMTITPVLDEHGEIGHFIAVKQDITERKRAEETAREAQQQLAEQQQREKEHVEGELEKVREELVRTTRLAAIGQISGSIAHDLRNPLGSARNAIYYLRNGRPKNQSKTAEYLEIIDQEIGSADRIIGKLLEMARAGEPAKQEVDLGQVVEKVFHETKEAERMRCRTAICPDPFLVQADPDQLRQVVGNLLTNAVHATEGRGEFFVEATRGPDGDTILIRDSGPGLAPEIRPHVFEPLVTGKVSGTGMGLTICREIIRRHGGTIEAIDSDQGGAAFRIRLPRSYIEDLNKE